MGCLSSSTHGSSWSAAADPKQTHGQTSQKRIGIAQKTPSQNLQSNSTASLK
jgi:hypothetical protein